MFRDLTSPCVVFSLISAMDNPVQEKRQRGLRAVALKERFVLLSFTDKDGPAGPFDDAAFYSDIALSAAERGVAELAARGLMNTEIARARRVAPRTISNQ